MFRFSMKPVKLLLKLHDETIHENFLRWMNSLTQRIIEERKNNMHRIKISAFEGEGSPPPNSSPLWVLFGVFSLSTIYYFFYSNQRIKE